MGVNQLFAFFLNLPYTMCGCLVALVSIPVHARLHSKPLVLIFTVRRFWWTVGYMRHARAMAIGHVVLLGPTLEIKDLEHELIHVEQLMRAPLIHPLLYWLELLRKGYKNNKYEIEAYQRAGNIYKEKSADQ